MYVVEFKLRAKPGHYAQLAEAYSSFAEDFLNSQPALSSVLIVGDEGSGDLRGIAVWADRSSADHVNSNPKFAAFNDRTAPMLAEAPVRVELELLHSYSKA